MGIEPTSKAWEAFILPMNYARVRKRFSFIRYSKMITRFFVFGNTEANNNFGCTVFPVNEYRNDLKRQRNLYGDTG